MREVYHDEERELFFAERAEFASGVRPPASGRVRSCAGSSPGCGWARRAVALRW